MTTAFVKTSPRARMEAIKKTHSAIGSASVSSRDMQVILIKRSSSSMTQSSTFGEGASHCAILTPATETSQVFESLAVSTPVKRICLFYKIVKANVRAVASSQKIEHSTSNFTNESYTDSRSKKIERTASETDVNSTVVFERFPADIREQILEQLDLQVSKPAFAVLSDFCL
jgi:hypothetical protein